MPNSSCVYEATNHSLSENTNFDNAVIDNAEYIGHLYNSGAQKIPKQIKTIQELKSALEKRNLDQPTVDHIIMRSKLPAS